MQLCQPAVVAPTDIERLETLGVPDLACATALNSVARSCVHIGRTHSPDPISTPGAQAFGRTSDQTSRSLRCAFGVGGGP
jgi:hypothetical protein